MKIVFATTQSLAGSTMIGRVLPLARHFASQHRVTVLALREANIARRRASPTGTGKTPGVSPPTPGVEEAPVFPARRPVTWFVGIEPFRRTNSGKQRLHGLALITNMLAAALRTTWQLLRLRPDCVIIIKTLPHNVLGAYLYKKMLRGRARVIIDVDDFELLANTVTSLDQRAAIHWAERAAVSLADHIVTVTPFLTDHFEQLARQQNVLITMIPTGVESSYKLQTANYSLKPTILYLGSLSIASGHRVDLLPAILEHVRRQVPDAHLTIAGSGDDEQRLRRALTERQLTGAVTWHGRFKLPTPDGQPGNLLALLQTAAVIVDPIDNSVVARAKSSFRVAVAAAVGLPCVTSNIGIRPYFLLPSLRDRSFARPGDPTSYAAKIVSFLREPLTDAERSSLTAHTQQYSWDRLAAAYQKIIVS